MVIALMARFTEMGVRVDVAENPDNRVAYIEGCVELSQTMSGLTSTDVDRILSPQIPGWSMRGAEVELSWWDLFSLWHYATMQIPTEGRRSNRAHGGPVFLPWHRLYLIRLEEVLQTVLDDPDFGLPYWDWAKDRQVGNPIWTVRRLGRNRGLVDTGTAGQLRVRLSGRMTMQGRFLEAHEPRPIERAAGLDPNAARLPRIRDVEACLAEATYDTANWDATSRGFRNHLEGWQPFGLHNLVHVWMGGDMTPATSPNDPAFYLNHCNVDRIWQMRMDSTDGLPYSPTGSGPAGHNIDDPLVALIGASLTPAEVLDPTGWYTYDLL